VDGRHKSGHDEEEGAQSPIMSIRTGVTCGPVRLPTPRSPSLHGERVGGR